jgi:RHS repeat-associated protein
MIQPGRKYTAGNAYRYGFNGQEVTNELGSNFYEAMYWEYDARIGRRWNLDPKPDVSVSLYSTFANNPIAFLDILGDTLEVGGVTQTSMDDIKNLVRSKNQKYLVFDKKTNRVTVDLSSLSADEQAKVLKNDKGLGLIKDIVDSDKKFLYEATDLGFYSNSAGDRQVSIVRQNDVNSVKNTSNFGADGGGGHDERPRSGYDGHLMVDTKTTWEELDASGSPIAKSRSSMVFHELAENYYRTHSSVNYQPDPTGVGLHKIGAHQLAIDLEKQWHMASNSPGGISSKTSDALGPNEVATANRYNGVYQTSGLTREDLQRIFTRMFRPF